MYTVVHYTAMHFQGPQSTWGALAVYKVTHVGSLHVYCSTLLCTSRWTQSTWGALAGCSVTQITTHHIYCSTLPCYALSGSSKYLGSISRLQCNIDNYTPCIL